MLLVRFEAFIRWEFGKKEKGKERAKDGMRMSERGIYIYIATPKEFLLIQHFRHEVEHISTSSTER